MSGAYQLLSRTPSLKQAYLSVRLSAIPLGTITLALNPLIKARRRASELSTFVGSHLSKIKTRTPLMRRSCPCRRQKS